MLCSSMSREVPELCDAGKDGSQLHGAHPPRMPHSPRVPLLTVWKQTISRLLAYGSPSSFITLRALTNGRSSCAVTDASARARTSAVVLAPRQTSPTARDVSDTDDAMRRGKSCKGGRKLPRSPDTRSPGKPHRTCAGAGSCKFCSNDVSCGT